MRKIFYIGIIVFISGILAACEIIIDDNPHHDGPIHYNPTLKVHSAALSSNYRDAGGRSYICDNRNTLLTYRFNFTGRLDSWRSYLKGAHSGKINGEGNFHPNHRGVIAFGNNSFEVTYVIHRGAAPLAIDSSKLASQSIITIPKPKVIGHTYLHLDIFGSGQSHSFRSDPPLPVVKSC